MGCPLEGSFHLLPVSLLAGVTLASSTTPLPRRFLALMWFSASNEQCLPFDISYFHLFQAYKRRGHTHVSGFVLDFTGATVVVLSAGINIILAADSSLSLAIFGACLGKV